MAKFIKYTFLIIAATLSSCYNEISLDEYRNENGENILTINSLICPDSTISVVASNMFFYPDIHNQQAFVKDLNIDLFINDEHKGKMEYNNARNIYTSDIKPQPGDKIKISTKYKGTNVWATDVMPKDTPIEKLEISYRGPVTVFSSEDFIYTYKITFTDNPNEENYYFLSWSDVERGKDVMYGQPDFKHEYVFQILANEIRGTIPGWEPEWLGGLPFSDKGIEGKTHTLVVDELLQHVYTSQLWRYSQMKRDFKLYSISKSYYDYLVGILLNRTDDGGLQGGMIDLGVADPIKIHSNINNGIGIMGCYSTSHYIVDVFKVVGPILPPKSKLQ